MRKILALLVLVIIFIVSGCSGDPEENTNDTSVKNNKGGSEQKTEQNEEKKGKKVYEIGETATITSGIYGFKYQVTVNSFEFADKIEGVTAEKLFNGKLQPGEALAVANVTIKNISNTTFIPKEKISGQFLSKNQSSENALDQFFKERKNKLKPGQKITGNLVYYKTNKSKHDFHLVYEYMGLNETKFILPNPNK